MSDFNEIKMKINKYSDKIFYKPLNKNEIRELEKSLDVEFPQFYTDYLLEIGLLQDFLKEDLFEIQSRFILENNFIKTNLQPESNSYFPIGSNVFGDLYGLREDSNLDDLIYIINHKTGKIKKYSKSFYQIINNSLDQAIREYKDRKLNINKVWSVQFNFESANEVEIFNNVKNKHTIQYDGQWKLKEVAPSGVSEYTKLFSIDDRNLILKKLNFEGWSNPVYSIDLDETIVINKRNSLIVDLDRIFSINQLEIGYKLVRYGIL